MLSGGNGDTVMPPRRQTTLFDLSSLRVHPDGTRVDQTDYNLRVKRHARAARDAHGNWMAHDAGGSVAVKRRLKQKEGKQGGTDISKDSSDEEEQVAQALKPRAAKRQKFSQDYSFLEALELSDISQAPAEAGALPNPSSVCDSAFTFVDPLNKRTGPLEMHSLHGQYILHRTRPLNQRI